MDRRYAKRMQAYWTRLEARARARIDRLDVSNRLDYWHLHPDGCGRGNAYAEQRMHVAALTIRLLCRLRQRTANAARPIQLWATLCRDTMDDAVFAHSPNPNGTPYPHAFDGVRWDAEMPEWVRAMADAEGCEAGVDGTGDSETYVIRCR